MGAAKSVTLRPEEVADLQSESSCKLPAPLTRTVSDCDTSCRPFCAHLAHPVSRKEIDKLFERFQKLDLGAKGAITGRDFLRIPEVTVRGVRRRRTLALTHIQSPTNTTTACHEPTGTSNRGRA